MILASYICSLLNRNFLFGILTAIGIMSAIYFTRIVESVADFGNIQLSYILQIIIYMWPYYVYLASPIVFGLAIIYLLNRLSSNGFFTTISSFGINFRIIIYYLLVYSAFISFCILLISFYLLPYSYHRYKELDFFLKNNYATISIEENIFISRIKDILIYIHKRNGNNLERIFIEDYRDKEKKTFIFAEKAVIFNNVDNANGVLELILNNGTILTLNKKNLLYDSKLMLTQKQYIAFFDKSRFAIDISKVFNTVADAVITDSNGCYPSDFYRYISGKQKDALLEYYLKQKLYINASHAFGEDKGKKIKELLQQSFDATKELEIRETMKRFVENKQYEYFVYGMQRILWCFLPLEITLLISCFYFRSNTSIKRETTRITSTMLLAFFCFIILIFTAQNLAIKKHSFIFLFIGSHFLPFIIASIWYITRLIFNKENKSFKILTQSG